MTMIGEIPDAFNLDIASIINFQTFCMSLYI